MGVSSEALFLYPLGGDVMVNTLSGSVSAYRKETVKPRFIRIYEVMGLLDVTRDEAMDIALAAGARYQLAKQIRWIGWMKCAHLSKII